MFVGFISYGISFYAHENKVIFKVIFCTTTCVALFAVLEI